MRFLGNSVIINATITATNVLSFAGEEKLQIYQLADKFRATGSSTVIDLDFGSNLDNIDYVALCGTNLSPTASVELSYSNTSIEAPEATITLPKFSNFNQIFMLTSAVQRRFWRVSIVDPNYQGVNATGVEIGYLSIGKYIQVDSWEFPHTPNLNLTGNPAISPTFQDFGTDALDYWSGSFNVTDLDSDGVNALFTFIKTTGRTKHFVLVEYEDSYDTAIYPPHYGVLTGTGYPYPAADTPNSFSLAFNFEERY